MKAHASSYSAVTPPPHLHSLERINIRVIDPFTIKPLDHKTIIDNARVTRGRIITVEDHYYEGEGRKTTKNSAAASVFVFFSSLNIMFPYYLTYTFFTFFCSSILQLIRFKHPNIYFNLENVK